MSVPATEIVTTGIAYQTTDDSSACWAWLVLSAASLAILSIFICSIVPVDSSTLDSTNFFVSNAKSYSSIPASLLTMLRLELASEAAADYSSMGITLCKSSVYDTSASYAMPLGLIVPSRGVGTSRVAWLLETAIDELTAS